MFNFLVKKFIKSDDFSIKENRDNLIKISGIMGLIINIFLFIIKLTIGLFINSISIISDSINNLSDSLTSIVTIIGAIISNKPADENHPYGHGRTEYVVTMFVGVFILVVSIQLLISAVKSIILPDPIKYSKYTIIILVISILLKLYMYFYNKYVGKKAESVLNYGVAKDSINDVFATIFVLISILVYIYTGYNIDGYIGVIISLIVFKTGLDLILETGVILLGEQIPESMRDEMRDIILQGKYIEGVHKIEIHEYGPGKFYGSCHVEVPANIDMFSMHKIINEVELNVYKKLGVELSIHCDPIYLLEEDHFYRVKDIKEFEKIDLDE